HTPDHNGWIKYILDALPDTVPSNEGSVAHPFKEFINGHAIKVVLDELEFEDGSYTVARPKSGKSTHSKNHIRSYLIHPNSAGVVVFDPSGDLAAQVARFKEFIDSDRLVYIDPLLGEKQDRLPSINPFPLPSQFESTTQEARIKDA